MIFSQDPSQPSFYYPVIISFFSVMMLLYLFKSYLYSKQLEKLKHSDSLEVRLLQDTLDPSKSYSDSIHSSKESLRYRYLIAYVLTRSSIWAKTAYLYTLYSTVHKFSMAEIGFLYVIDAVSALIFGPITGNLADILGRKLFCMGYCVFVISNLSLRLTGSRPLAYVAQILTGIATGLINTTFESWLNYEASKVFSGSCDNEEECLKAKQRFLKKIFKMENFCDAMMCIGVSFLSAILYTIYGIFAPLIFSISLACGAFTVIGIFWGENNPNEESKKNIGSTYKSAFKELQKREVLSVGMLESLFHAVLNIYIFAWTPILQSTSHEGNINIGLIYNCFVLSLITGTMIYEIIVIYLKFDYFKCMTGLFLFETVCLFYVYFVNNFTIRLVLLSFVNGCSGFYNPLNSVVKSNILREKLRALMMSLFRIPLNIYVISVLLFLKYLDPYQICLIASMMTSIAFLISLSLVIWPPKGNNVKLDTGNKIHKQL